MNDDNENKDNKLELRFNGQLLDGEHFHIEANLNEILKDLPKSDTFIPGIVDGSAVLHYEPVDKEAIDEFVKSLSPSFEAPILPGHYADLVKHAIEAARQQNCKPVQLLLSEALMAGLWEETRGMIIGDTSGVQITGAEGEFWGVPFKQADMPEGLLGQLETDARWTIDIRK